jgi:hypothetical protein
MARTYHVDIAQYVANADRKWVDNLLSHFRIPGVEKAERGVARRIATNGIYHIALVRQLTQRLDLGVSAAVSIAAHLLAEPVEQLSLPVGLELRFDRDTFQNDVNGRIADAVESVTPARRGRPRQRDDRRRAHD